MKLFTEFFQLFCWMALSHYAFSQATSVVDSLQYLLRQTHTDTVRIRLLNELAYEWAYRNKDTAMQVSNKALHLALTTNHQQGIAASYNVKGIIHYDMGNLDSALFYYLEALQYFEKINDTYNIMQSYQKIGQVHQSRNSFEEAFTYYEKALDIAQMLNHSKLLGNAYNNLGSLYISRGWYIIDNENDTVNYIQYFEEAEPYLMKAIVYFEEVGYEKGVALCYGNLALLKSETGAMEKALEYGFKALEYFEKLDYKIYTAISYNQIGEIYFRMRQYDNALAYVSKSLEVSNAIESKFDIRNAYGKFSAIYETLGNYKKALEYNKLYHDVHNTILNEDNQSQINKLEQQYQAAEKEQKIRLLNKDRALQKAQIRRQKYILIFALTVVSLFVILTTLLQQANNQKKKMNRILEARKSELEQKNAEIKQQHDLLEQQNRAINESNARLEELNEEQKNMMAMVAHDLKSPLNKINGLVEIMEMSGPLNAEQKSMKEKIQHVTTSGHQLVLDLTMLSLYENDGEPVTRELYLLESLMQEIMGEHNAYASGKNIRLHLSHIEIEEDLYIHTHKELFTRIIDNLLSNAIKFSPPGRDVHVKIWRVHDSWKISVTDEGPGLSEEDQRKMFKKFQRLSARPTGGESSTGLGLAIVKILTHKLEGEITVESTVGKGTTFILAFPFECNA